MKPHQTWLEKAGNGLNAAKELFLDTDPALDKVFQFTLDSAAKALKAFLKFQGQPFDETNDLTELIAQCAELDPTFSALSDPAEELTAYGIIFRDPEAAEITPEKNEATEAVQLAEFILKFVAAKICQHDMIGSYLFLIKLRETVVPSPFLLFISSVPPCRWITL